MPVVLCAANVLHCTECGTEFTARGGRGKHPTYSTLGLWIEHSPILKDPRYLAKLQGCSNAGKTFQLPVAAEVKE